MGIIRLSSVVTQLGGIGAIRSGFVAAATFALAFFFSFYAVGAEEPRSEEAPAVAAPAYALPWQLGSVMIGNAARVDSGFAFYNDKAGTSGGFAAATMASGSYKITSDLAAILRMGMVNNTPPAGGAAATMFTNPLLGCNYALNLPNHLRMAFFLGVTLPIGSGVATPRSGCQSRQRRRPSCPIGNGQCSIRSELFFRCPGRRYRLRGRRNYRPIRSHCYSGESS